MAFTAVRCRCDWYSNRRARRPPARAGERCVRAMTAMPATIPRRHGARWPGP